MPPPVAKFPEVYGAFLGAFLGVVSSWIYGWAESVIPVKLMGLGGAAFGAFFGAGVRLIYLLSLHRVPYGFVTLVTLGICLPLYVGGASIGKDASPDVYLGITAISPGVVLLVLVVVESWRIKSPVARVPEIYGFFIGAFLGVVNTIVAVWLRVLLGVNMIVREGMEVISAVMVAIDGAIFGLLFGFGLRMIYRMSHREVPFGLVTLVTLGICIPLYVVSTYQAMVEKNFAISFYSTLASPFTVLLVLAALEWWRVRSRARLAAVGN